MTLEVTMPGPPPKRSTERRRRNKPETPITTLAGADPAAIPGPDPGWHQLATDWYLSLAASGQAALYQPSDWQAARYVATVMTGNLNAGRFSAQLFGIVWGAMGELLTTEGARRRLRVELERVQPADEDETAATVALDDYRRRLSS